MTNKKGILNERTGEFASLSNLNLGNDEPIEILEVSMVNGDRPLGPIIPIVKENVNFGKDDCSASNPQNLVNVDNAYSTSIGLKKKNVVLEQVLIWIKKSFRINKFI
jgi:hypothetical protein